MAPAARAAPVSMMARPAGGKAELEALAEAQQIPMGFWDPLGLADKDFWGQGNEATIGFLRHAEIKHGARRAVQKVASHGLSSERLETALRTREERPIISDATERPWPWSHAPPNSPMSRV
tara:strand:+ start:105 stop:467 length:363 start_codon:yes stop_codon:yes gene_type:complete